MGFPVGLIASIQAVLEEEQLVNSEEADITNEAQRRAVTSDNSTTQLAVPKATLQSRMITPEAGIEPKDDGGVKRRVSDITLSERFSFRPSKTKFDSTASLRNLSVQSEHHINPDRSTRMRMQGDVNSLLADLPPISPLRRYSSSSEDRSPREPLRRDPQQEKQKEQQRRSSITMPLCPSRKPTFMDLESVVQSVGEDFLALGRVGGSLTATSTSRTSGETTFALENLTLSRDSEENATNEKSIDTIVAKNLRGTSNHQEGDSFF
jgi:hypothetical protein